MHEESKRSWGERHGGAVIAGISVLLLILVLVIQSSC
jgi:hypothetical protein